MRRFGASFMKEDAGTFGNREVFRHCLAKYAFPCSTLRPAQLERCNRDNVKVLEEIVGVDCDSITYNGASTAVELRARGHYWAQHVLEAPKSWIICFVYIIATVWSPLVFSTS